MALLFASTNGETVVHEGQAYPSLKLPDAVKRLRPGDTLHIAPGTYSQPVTLLQSGLKSAPITLTGAIDGGTIFDGQTDREAALSAVIPSIRDFAFIKLIDARHIIIENLTFRNCWPSAVYLQGARDVAVRHCRVSGGRYAVYARSLRFSPRKTKNVVLDGVSWVQDVDHDMWEGRVKWQDVKQPPGEETTNNAGYFGGALFGSYKFRKSLTIRNCDVSHAFNAIRLEAGRDAGNFRYNKDIRIVGNRFSYIRDNAVEPEGSVTNLWVADNILFNVHAAFSLDGVGGNHWYFIGNRMLNARRPGLEADGYGRGKIFKFFAEPPFAGGPFYAAFNSIQTRTAYATGGQTRRWTHKNNAVGICLSDENDCDPRRRMFEPDFKWHESYDFAGDICDHPDFPEQMRARSHLVNGHRAEGGTFAALAPSLFTRSPSTAWDGILNLKLGSVGQKKSVAMRIDLPEGRHIDVPGGRDVGAPAPSELLDLAISNP